MVHPKITPVMWEKEEPLVWDTVQLARHSERLKPQDIIQELFPDFMELHGDRCGGDDASIMGGIATFHGRPVTVIGIRRGHDLKENLQFRFGMPQPEGYRKALRLMQQAAKFNRPVITWIDTPGAYPGLDSEERGISESIAKNLFEMSSLPCPIISIVTGEGGSGGALALMLADQIAMFEHSVLSVISPEGCASILFKDATQAPHAAQHLGMNADYLYKNQVIDHVIREDDWLYNTKEWLQHVLDVLCVMPLAERLDQRYQKFRRMGDSALQYDE